MSCFDANLRTSAQQAACGLVSAVVSLWRHSTTMAANCPLATCWPTSSILIDGRPLFSVADAPTRRRADAPTNQAQPIQR